MPTLPPPTSLGRVTFPFLNVRAEPNTQAEAVAHYFKDDVMPGVGFPIFLTWDGVAIHTAYWHNDFGTKRSHGCPNVPAAVSRWVWRWTSPFAPYNLAYYNTPRNMTGTRVIVRERFSAPNTVGQM